MQIPWSIVLDDGSPAEGLVGDISFSMLALKVSGTLWDPELEGVALANEASRANMEKFTGAPVAIELAVDVVTDKVDVKQVDVATHRFSAEEEGRLRKALTDMFTSLGTLQAVLAHLSPDD